MIRWRSRIRAGLSLALCLASCSAPLEPPAPRLAGRGTLIVRVEGFESAEGKAWIALFLGPEGFPNEGEKAYRYANLPLQGTSLSLVFEEVPAGPFAISAFHDKDEDDALGMSFLGWPTESWGVSRDAGGFLGPPSYEDAELFLHADQTLEVRIPLG